MRLAAVGAGDKGMAMQIDEVMPVSVDAISTDGRIARGVRTRRHVAEALISLLEDGETQPTARKVAERAGVSLRLVFHHFEDMDALYRAVMVLQAQRYWSKVRDVPPDLPTAHRIDRSVRQRSRLFDAIGAVRRAAVPLATRSAPLAEALTESSSFLRGRLAHTFALELNAAGAGAGDLLDAIDAAASWETWERLRRVQDLPPVAARRVMGLMIAALLAPAPPATGTGESTDQGPAGSIGQAHATSRR
jgi:AcrR family transcriptional regulator